MGSGIAFVPGIRAFHYQQRRQAEKKEEDDRRAALNALNLLSIAAVANIEVLALTKLQFINNMQPEIEKMKAVVEEIYNTTRSTNRAKNILALKVLSASLRYFYKHLPRISVMPPPDVGEYSSPGKDMPALTLFVHRAKEAMRELNERIKSRNAHIAGHVRERETGAGMSNAHLIHYSLMLASKGQAICVLVDYDLGFWRLVLDQVNAYMTTKAKDKHFPEHKMAPGDVEAMPKDKLFPRLREQLVTFDDQAERTLPTCYLKGLRSCRL